MEFVSTRNMNSIYDEMKARLYKENSIEIAIVCERYINQTDRKSIFEKLEDEFVLNLFKVDEIISLKRCDDEIKKKFCEQKLYIEGADISSKQKVNVILTTACLFTRIYDKIKDLDNKTLYSLAISMVEVQLKEYPLYGKILTSQEVLSLLKYMSENDKEILNNDSFIVCDECGQCELSEPTYQKAMKLVLPVLIEQNNRK